MSRQELITAFLRMEAAIGLLSRCKPVNFDQEAQALQAAWQGGQKRNPRWHYAPTPALRELRVMLGDLRKQLLQGPWSALWESRCDELALEIQIIEAIGQPAMPTLSKRRFCDPVWAPAALSLAVDWASTEPSPHAERECTDSPAATSLLNQMRRTVANERLSFRVATSESLVSAAATGEGVIWVASGSWIYREEVPRIVVHEVFGHAWPRARAASESCELFAVGSARGNDTQEGYAVWQEVITQTQTPRRRQELGLRHLAAQCVWQGADWVQTVDALLERGVPPSAAQNIALRSHRGGGLAREAVYLQAYCQVLSAIDAEPHILPWLGAGRLDLDAIASLREMGYELCTHGPHTAHGANSATTGM